MTKTNSSPIKLLNMQWVWVDPVQKSPITGQGTQILTLYFYSLTAQDKIYFPGRTPKVWQMA